jgi:hypothetical protein
MHLIWNERQAVSKKVSFVGTFYIEELLEIAPLDLKNGLYSFQQRKKCSKIYLNKEHQSFSGISCNTNNNLFLLNQRIPMS